MEKFYKFLLVASAPFFVWTSFELYGLTVFGSQMLFYSITHTMPTLVSVILLSVIFYMLLLIVNVLSVFFTKLKIIDDTLLLIFIFMQVLHALLLFSYDYWATTIARIPICIVGLTMLIFGSFKIIDSVFFSENNVKL